ncbi:MAG: glycosyltransferase family 2 protein [Prolixibacteraceae bacterium]|nr:glycosyltransferase family 2 protein [Prolixibacteraceae bacterium]
MTIVFWIFFALFFYAYFGYAIILYVITRFIPLKTKPELPHNTGEYPQVTLFITAYNELDILQKKIDNCHALDYPHDKLHIVFVTDGSNDGSDVFLSKIPGITVYHSQQRKGKINAMNRGMALVKTDIVVFTDANTELNTQAIKEIATCFFNPKVGCVAGRKRVVSDTRSGAAAAGEGLYWRFESWLKKLDARFFAPVGAVGELFSVRTSLFEPVPDDTILDDMVISFNIIKKGYLLTYEPQAIASETASFNMAEELKRKVRIAAGGWQTLFRSKQILNPFKYPRLAFQFFSHKVSRWTFAPWCFFLLLPLNVIIVLQNSSAAFWWIVLTFQLLFYLLAYVGKKGEASKRRVKLTFLPFYFVAINWATILGQVRYLKGNQPAAWDKAKRLQ